MVEGHQGQMLVDTGTSADIIDEKTWYAMNINKKLESSTTQLIPYGSERTLSMLGSFDANLQRKDRVCQSKLYVVQGQSGYLPGYESSHALGSVIINMVTPMPSGLASDNIIAKFPRLFSGLGQLKGMQVKLHIDPSVQPVKQPQRRVPFHVRPKVEQKLEDAGIIEKIEGPTPWVSPIVTPPKPHDPTEIRLCVDMRGPNKAILRERHITPTIEDVLSDLKCAKFFSKLDLNQGYHQLTLAEESRYITTFSTHVGLRRYKRLNFGISCTSEIFQNTIQTVLEGLDGVMNVSNDILIYSSTTEQHKQRL